MKNYRITFYFERINVSFDFSDDEKDTFFKNLNSGDLKFFTIKEKNSSFQVTINLSNLLYFTVKEIE